MIKTYGRYMIYDFCLDGVWVDFFCLMKIDLGIGYIV